MVRCDESNGFLRYGKLTACPIENRLTSTKSRE